MAIPDTLVPAARRCVLLAVAAALGISMIAGPGPQNEWCGPASLIFDLVGSSPGLPAQRIAGAALAAAVLADAVRDRVTWISALAFTVAGAVYVENAARIHHVWHLPALLLWVEATAALANERVRAATIGIWHCHAAISKLQAHGLAWADGASMAVWIDAFAYSHARWASRLPTWVLAGGQAAALAVEALAPLAILERARWWVGVALCSFYAGVLVTFPFGFFANLLLVWLYLVRSQTGHLPASRRAQGHDLRAR